MVILFFPVHNSIHMRCFEKEKGYATQIKVASLNTIKFINGKNILSLRGCLLLCTPEDVDGNCMEKESYANQITLACLSTIAYIES